MLRGAYARNKKIYGEAVIRISDFALLEGKLPPKIHGLVIEWSSLHREELEQDWEQAKQSKPLFKIEPLE